MSLGGARVKENRTSEFAKDYSAAAVAREKERPHPYRPRRRRRPPEPINALVLLNQVRPGLHFQLRSRTGPVHAPIFAMAVEVDGRVYEGSGPTKKKAKLGAAEEALHAVAPPARTSPPHLDFTSDLDYFPGVMFGDLPPLARPLARPATPKSPVMLLNELQAGVRYEVLSESGESHAKSFVVSVTIGGESFQGSGRNKRLAKARAAQAALAALFHVVPERAPSQQPILREGQQLHLPQEMADAVSGLVLKKFSELTDGLASPHSRRKVLAGVVLTEGAGMEAARVICISTGTKCISGEHLSGRGLALNDSHAEVLARRSLIRFLYSELELLLSASGKEHQQSIFSGCDGGRGFRLREDVQFHLYISTSPCGDARIFSPHEACEGQEDGHPSWRARGQLRTKVESGEGTVPVCRRDTTQTWDEVLQGERLLGMSCSDKIARWNVLGLQGSLLTYFTEPIYFSSIILGSLYHAGHLSRAVYGRVANLGELPPPFALRRPLLSGISNAEARQPGKAPNFSANWTLGDQGLEVVDAMTGKDDLGLPSRLCKHTLYSRWMRLYCQLSSRLRIRTARPSTYLQAKQAATEYQGAKQSLLEAFCRAGLGAWMKKLVEQDHFSIDP